MFRKIVLVGALAFGPLMAIAAEKPEPEFRTITFNAGQGSPVKLSIPVSQEAPYALTGSALAKTWKMVRMQFGQGASFLVPQPQ